MYPNLYFAFKDLFGVDVPAFRFVNSFGFFVALAFLAAAAILTAELKRKSKAGLLVPSDEHVVVGQPVTPFELISNFILGFVLGYKILALFFLGAQATEDPQAFIFSTQGSWPLGLGLGLLFAGMKWWEKKKQQLPTPEKRTLRIWPQDRVGEITVLALIFGLLGAKLFDIFENWSDFLQHPADYILSPAGLTFYGGLICAAIAIILFARKHKIPLRHLADGVAPALMLAYAIGRIGCQVAGDGDWGIVNNNPKPFNWLPDWMWAFRYPNNVNEAGVPIHGCVGKYCNILPEAVYPTPFYETIMATIFFLILWSLRKKLKPFGAVFALYLIFNGLERFLIEQIRVNNKMDFLGLQPTQAEIIAIGLILTGIGLWIYLQKKYGAKLAKL
ncbi:MAG TPA: prolipoprotein diacylglyceryl transferase [Flavisolibacter sp.]|nr:prolipoprotein diacylglyceryl transferase [Flavisolibacter sp.]